ncbi:MAG TPA: BTAD domain-containing putative transcriptional regulator [Pseudonocardia sp.]|nr:BTAD domain-containing putative transcriptional regulator [Pseudonocardia sp.]
MRFRILGPLEVEADGAIVNIGGPKPRTLLAALLIRHGTVVSDDRLVEALWGDQPPRGAISALRAYTSRLRAALGDQVRLDYRAPGYTLAVADDELDAAEFERLLRAARSVAAADAVGDAHRALALADAALSLWRGDALAEFTDLEFARAEAARLDELRLGAAEERIDALLRLARAEEALPEAELLVRRFPTRERTVVALMRALYASGRQAEALATYHELRRRLDDELAVEPSEPAQTLYRRILGQDPTLRAAAGGGNLPRRATSFVGRAREIRDVTAALAGTPLVTLTGVGGVGKSRLALEVAGHDRARYPDGTWLCELAPLDHGGPVGHAVAVALRLQQRHGLTIEHTVIEYLRSRKLLLVLDNCEHVLDAAARLVDQVVRECPSVAVLATSREPLGVDGEHLRPVSPLPGEDAGRLFVQRVQANRPDFRPGREEAGAIADICRRLDGLPLGIELAAARMRAMSATEIARRLDGGRFLSGGPRTASARHQSLAAAIDWSYHLLPEPEQRLFARLSVFAGGFDLPGVHEVCAEPGTTDDTTLDLLTRLVDKSMVTTLSGAGRSRYRVLETLRARGRELLRDSGPHEQLDQRHARYFVELAERAARGLHTEDEQAWVERTLPDYDNLRAAFECAAAGRDVDLALRLVTSLPELVHLRLGYESADWAERTLDLAPHDHPLFAAAVGAAARGAWNRGDFAHARQLAERAGGRFPARGTGRIAYPADVLADVALYEGDAASPLEHYAAEAARARRDADPIRLVWTLYYVAVCHAVRRTPERGVSAARECVRVADGTVNPTARSMAHYALGLVLKKSDPEQALALFDQAGALAASVRNFWWHGIAVMEAAATRAVHRDPAAAAREFVDVLDHWDRVGDWTQQWLNLRYVVRLLVRLGADEDAVVLHHSLRAAGKPSPLGTARLTLLLDGPDGPLAAAAARSGSRLTPSEAVSIARSCLHRYS